MSGDLDLGVFTEFPKPVLKCRKDEISLSFRKVPIVARTYPVVVLDLPHAPAPFVPDVTIGEFQTRQVLKGLRFGAILIGISAFEVVFPDAVRNFTVEPVAALSSKVVVMPVLADPLAEVVAVIDIDPLVVIKPIPPNGGRRDVSGDVIERELPGT